MTPLKTWWLRRSVLAAVVLIVLGTLLAGRPVMAQATSGCLPADTARMPQHLDLLKRLVTATDSNTSALRDSLTLQAVAANKVTFVTKAATCAAGANALNLVAGTPGVIRQVWVYALGGNFAVEDPGMTLEEGEEYPIYLFDSKWKSKPVLMN